MKSGTQCSHCVRFGSHVRGMLNGCKGAHEYAFGMHVADVRTASVRSAERELPMKLLSATMLTASLTLCACSGSDASSLNSSGANSGKSGESAAPSSEWDAYFGAPQGTATPDEVMGRWAMVLEDGDFQFDIRLQLAPSEFTVAQRCTYKGKVGPTVGATVAARISDKEITTLESKKSEAVFEGVTCRVAPAPSTFSRCDGESVNCFKVEKTKLTMYGKTPLEEQTYTKISD